MFCVRAALDLAGHSRVPHFHQWRGPGRADGADQFDREFLGHIRQIDGQLIQRRIRIAFGDYRARFVGQLHAPAQAGAKRIDQTLR